MPDVRTEVEKAYLAGLFDGEAFIGVTYAKRSIKNPDLGRCYVPKIRIHMTHEATIQRVVDLVGGRVYVDKKYENVNQSYGWDCPRGLMLQLLRDIQPYSTTKRRAVDLMVTLVDYQQSAPFVERDPSFENAVAEMIRDLTSTSRRMRAV